MQERRKTQNLEESQLPASYFLPRPSPPPTASGSQSPLSTEDQNATPTSTEGVLAGDGEGLEADWVDLDAALAVDEEMDAEWGGIGLNRLGNANNPSLNNAPIHPNPSQNPFETMDVDAMMKELRDLQAGRLRESVAFVVILSLD